MYVATPHGDRLPQSKGAHIYPSAFAPAGLSNWTAAASAAAADAHQPRGAKNGEGKTGAGQSWIRSNILALKNG